MQVDVNELSNENGAQSEDAPPRSVVTSHPAEEVAASTSAPRPNPAAGPARESQCAWRREFARTSHEVVRPPVKRDTGSRPNACLHRMAELVHNHRGQDDDDPADELDRIRQRIPSRAAMMKNDGRTRTGILPILNVIPTIDAQAALAKPTRFPTQSPQDVIGRPRPVHPDLDRFSPLFAASSAHESRRRRAARSGLARTIR